MRRNVAMQQSNRTSVYLDLRWPAPSTYPYASRAENESRTKIGSHETLRSTINGFFLFMVGIKNDPSQGRGRKNAWVKLVFKNDFLTVEMFVVELHEIAKQLTFVLGSCQRSAVFGSQAAGANLLRKRFPVFVVEEELGSKRVFFLRMKKSDSLADICERFNHPLLMVDDRCCWSD